MQLVRNAAQPVPPGYLCYELPFTDLVTLLLFPARNGAHLHRGGQSWQGHLEGTGQCYNPDSPDSRNPTHRAEMDP